MWNPAKPNQVLISRDVLIPLLEPGEAGITITTAPEKESASPPPSLGDDDFQQLIFQETLTEEPPTPKKYPNTLPEE